MTLQLPKAIAEKTTVFSLGGSLIVPNGGVDTRFLNSFKKMVMPLVKKGHRFVFVTGGGGTARSYINAAKQIGGLTNDDFDWLGIHATRLNGHLLRTIFRDHAYPVVVKDPSKTFTRKWKEPIMVAAGWKPGWSTDYIAVRLAKRMGVKHVVNLSNIDYLYDKDPKKYPSAKPVKEITWKEYRAMVGDDWTPGMNVPFDPIASRLAHHSGIKVTILSSGPANVKKFFAGDKFKGSIIQS